jgi:hypothetical protein
MFSKASEVIQIIKDELIDYDNAIFLGAGILGLERYTFDLTKDITAYEWSDDRIKEIEALGVKAIKADITELESIEADVVTLFDFLEHLTKEQALQVLDRIKAKQVVMFIPIQDKFRRGLDELIGMQTEAKESNGVLNQHLSLWTPEELEELGFKVYYKEKYFGKNHGFWGAAICVKNNI